MIMADDKAAKLKALQLTLDKLDKTYGKGSVMKLGDEVVQDVEAISSGSLGLDIALGDRRFYRCGTRLRSLLCRKTWGRY
jgi:recombination protein RecA